MGWHRFTVAGSTWGGGYMGKWGWLHLSGSGGTVWLDIWRWRIRWTGRDYRPLFSERYGYQKWHSIGRLAFHYNRPNRETS